MRRYWLMAAALAAAPAAAQDGSERLVPPADVGVRLGFMQGDMREYVPAGESVEAWTRMVTVQRLGYRPGLTPAAFLRVWLAGLSRACGVPAPEPVAATLGGHAAAEARFDCPRNPATGKPETVLGRAVMGAEALHMIEAATRRAPEAADLAWMRRVADGATLCAAGSVAGACGS